MSKSERQRIANGKCVKRQSGLISELLIFAVSVANRYSPVAKLEVR